MLMTLMVCSAQQSLLVSSLLSEWEFKHVAHRLLAALCCSSRSKSDCLSPSKAKTEDSNTSLFLLHVCGIKNCNCVLPGVVHVKEKVFAARCVSVSRCSAVYASGLHVVVWRGVGNNQMAAMVEVPQSFFNRTVGLLGFWSSNRSDDFLMSDGKILLSEQLKPPDEGKLQSFGLSCECTMDTLVH